MKNKMKLLSKYLVLLLMILIVSCGVKSKQPLVNQSILGSWEGCDGRTVTYTIENDQIIGRLTKLGTLATYGFKVDEVGFMLENKTNGVYKGKVKWRYKRTWADRHFFRHTLITLGASRYF